MTEFPHGTGAVFETSIYRDGISGSVYLYYNGKWCNVDDLVIPALPEQYKRAIKNSIFKSDSWKNLNRL